MVVTQPDITGLGSDADLIEQAKRVPERFTAIFDRHYQTIFSYVARRLGPDLAEDVASETFLIAFDRRQSFDADHGDARPWLFGIASNLVARHVRAESRRYRALARAGEQDLGEQRGTEYNLAGTVAGRLDAAAVRGRLAEALEKLPEPVRAVLLLVAWAGLNQQEAAVALGIPAGTARSRLHRARQAMRQALGTEIEMGE
ncbi:DNA-directed RNA polymerase sigma-70 factor [Actinoplanes ianthinogenes]|uniref:DNA-directed RNA polymerase sigma-70 factor n=1 Tax=Actinoplanes ianthinogenes TaxID=122358 RepID=A0ABM7M803_9ACTN|nr:RNA polymerase sigma factor [Actinoplanes ianthinogenes]BCJ47768.1 DNA-directed RNA polymerase sigma-70 factor [Actinoplanes ianthinogenes]GGR04056.1 DNA-directed RNA polymerase sigma-70 factor [Actinoplanes ianthinogenes]